jgi:hypothetical protein
MTIETSQLYRLSNFAKIYGHLRKEDKTPFSITHINRLNKKKNPDFNIIEIDNMQFAYVTPELNQEISELKRRDILDRGADVSNFGDPVKWQREERIDRKLK